MRVISILHTTSTFFMLKPFRSRLRITNSNHTMTELSRLVPSPLLGSGDHFNGLQPAGYLVDETGGTERLCLSALDSPLPSHSLMEKLC